MYRKRRQLMELAVCVIDAIATMVSLLIAGMLRYRGMQQMLIAENVQGLCSMMLVVHIAAFYFLKIYSGFFRRGRYREIILSVKYNLVLVAGTMLLGFSMKNVVFVSRLVMGYFFLINTLLIWIIHLFVRNKDRVFHWSRRRVTNLLVVTTKEHFPEICDRFHKSKETTWNIMGVILLNNEEKLKEINGVTVISDTEEAYLEYATLNVVDEVFIQLDALQRREHFLKHMILEFEKMGVVVNLNLDLFNLGVTGEKRIYALEDYNVVAFSSKLFDYRMVFAKRIIDIIGALVGLAITFVVGIFLAPILLLESPGPLIFKQKRVGVNGRIFDFYKFRSMYKDAEERKKELMKENEMQGLMFKMENDPRITKVGAFIRKTSIDELPQFWNVLKGDMSLVGTRPPTLDEWEKYEMHHRSRLAFKPGLTGMWQVSGRSNITDFEEVVRLDTTYIKQWSPVLDIKILLKTVAVVLGKVGSK